MKFLVKIKKLFKQSKQSLKIFIDNFGFVNRGDQLMIQSVLEQIRLRIPEAQVYVRQNVFMQNPTYCLHNNIQPLELSNSGIRHSKLYAKIVNFLLRKEYVVTPRQIDVVLDCCGYYITDAWHKSEEDYYSVKNYYSLFNNKNIKVIYLPQAFGPFRNEWSKEIARLVLDRATKIYAREQISLSYMTELLGDNGKLSIAPDFTCLCAPSEDPVIQLPNKDYVLVIPNSNMISQTDEHVADKYMTFLKSIVEELSAKGETIYLLNHEGYEDEQLLLSLNKLLKRPLPILTNLSGLDIKSVIKNAKLVISARFHGVVSALTQNVPTLCTSWSHKYAELLKEHRCEQSMLDVEDISHALLVISDALANPTKYTSKVGCEEKIEGEVNEMWNEIFSVL
jgi:colanic acid/amylovoran biosynthesis protein